ncbi:hypothetical protein BDZ89DRAFT_1084130 [Hymenopellis radicata]|nr:hypothetical protein BDZ89DRAFT_1084130 [Hymenopellis radicata]
MPATKPRLPHVLPSTPPPASPRKLRSTWSSADFGNALLSNAPILLDIPRLLLPCVEEADSAGVYQDLFPLFDRKPEKPRRVSDSVADSVATVTSSVVVDSSPDYNVRRSGSTLFSERRGLKGVDRRESKARPTTMTHSCPSAFHDARSEYSYHHEEETREQKTLRRRGGITQLRMSAPASSSPLSSPSPSHASRRPISHPTHSSTASIASTSSIPITQFQSHYRSHSQSNIPRLGARRPYYSSVIRKDIMSRPSTSHDFRSDDARPVSPFNISPSCYASTTSGRYFDDIEWEKPPELSPPYTLPSARSTASYTPGEFGYIPPTAAYNSGFSLSGETELRMALADDDAGSYKYKDMRKRGVRMHVRRLGQGIWEKFSHFRK